MRKLFVLVLGLLVFQTAQAQFKAGAKIGLSTQNISKSDIATFTGAGGLDSLKVTATDAGYGFHIGGFVRVPVGPAYIEASPLFGSSKIDYTIEDVSDPQNIASAVTSETFLKLDLPVLVGIKVLKFLRVQAGPVGSIVLTSTDNLTTTNGISTTWSGMTWGYQAGAGIDLGDKLTIDANFEGSFTGLNDEVTIGSQTFKLDERASRFVVTVGIPLMGK